MDTTKAMLAHAARVAADDYGKGRPIAELLKSKEVLKGVESQRLRTYCSSTSLVPAQHLDAYGMQLLMGELSAIQADFASRVENFRKDCEDEGSAKNKAAHELATLRWGPTAVPIYNLLGLSSQIYPRQRPQHLSIARWLVGVAQVPINGTDASGTTALAHSISTHSSFDPEFAQILYDAGGDVNLRNRYGATPGHAMCMVLSLDERDLRRTEKALAWFVAHGGNVDAKDSDGFSPRMAAGITAKRFASKGGNRLLMILEQEDNRRERRRDRCCMFCGREDVKLLQCGRCKEARYCEPALRPCHKLDWPRHKLGCHTA